MERDQYVRLLEERAAQLQSQFGSLEQAQKGLLKEEQEYHDALIAYNEVLGSVASTMTMPAVFQQQHSPFIRGHEEAATQPYINEQYPDLADAADRLAKEEADYRALDATVASFAQGNCSISNYTAEKVYEYYAALEMIYKLATDEEFRNQVIEAFPEVFEESAINDIFTIIGVYGDIGIAGAHGGAGSRAIAGAVNEDIAARNEARDEVGREASQRLASRVANYFRSLWDDVKEKYRNCGLFYAVATVGVDGAFVAAEGAVGLGFLRGLKFVRTLLPDGNIRVEVTDVGGRSLGQQEWNREALDAKYGRPEENHLGGFEPDTNREIPDRSADDMLAERRERDAEESRAHRADERNDRSYRDTRDPEGVRRSETGEAMILEGDEWTPLSQVKSNNLKGNFGEMMADHWAENQNPPWEKINGPNATMDMPGHQGLDAVYRNPAPPPDFYVADAKYGTAGLGVLKDGTTQMSPRWIRDRVNSEFNDVDSDEILGSYEPGILRIDNNGNVEWKSLSNRTWRDEDK